MWLKIFTLLIKSCIFQALFVFYTISLCLTRWSWKRLRSLQKCQNAASKYRKGNYECCSCTPHDLFSWLSLYIFCSLQTINVSQQPFFLSLGLFGVDLWQDPAYYSWWNHRGEQQKFGGEKRSLCRYCGRRSNGRATRSYISISLNLQVAHKR